MEITNNVAQTEQLTQVPILSCATTDSSAHLHVAAEFNVAQALHAVEHGDHLSVLELRAHLEAGVAPNMEVDDMATGKTIVTKPVVFHFYVSESEGKTPLFTPEKRPQAGQC